MGMPTSSRPAKLYLLRNLSRGRGVGFFEADSFHPDFILWLLAEGQQRVVFVDPKGIRNLGPNDPKIQFFETIKEIEERLGDPDVSLQSFIVSNTPSTTMRRLWQMEKREMAEAPRPFSGRGQGQLHWHHTERVARVCAPSSWNCGAGYNYRPFIQ